MNAWFVKLLLGLAGIVGAAAGSFGQDAYSPPQDIAYRRPTSSARNAPDGRALFASRERGPTAADDHHVPRLGRNRPAAAARARGLRPGRLFRRHVRLSRLGATAKAASSAPGRSSAASRASRSPPRSRKFAKSSIRSTRRPTWPTSSTGSTARSSATRSGSACGAPAIPAATSSMRPPAIHASRPRSARSPAWTAASCSAASGRKQTMDEATQRTRGEIGYPEPGAVAVGNLEGADPRTADELRPRRRSRQSPDCAMLFIIAEKEELFDNRDHGIKAHDLAQGPKKLVTIPNITHYGIYNEARQQSPETRRLSGSRRPPQALAAAWVYSICLNPRSRASKPHTP